MEKHGFDAYYNKNSKILILGSFPSVKSRAEGFYYAHPQNRFWKVLSVLFNEEIANDIKSKKDFLNNHNIALFDVCKACNITGSSDASIKDVVPNDLAEIIKKSSIKAVFLNGEVAYKLYLKYHSNIKLPVFKLPSTSPANALYHMDDLINAYKIILSYI